MISQLGLSWSIQSANSKAQERFAVKIHCWAVNCYVPQSKVHNA